MTTTKKSEKIMTREEIFANLKKQRKQVLLDKLNAIASKPEQLKKLPKELAGRVSYTMKKAAEKLSNVTVDDLCEVAADIVVFASKPAPVEKSLKPRAKIGKKKTETPKEEIEEEDGKSYHKVGEPKPNKVEDVPPITEKSGFLPTAKIFPAEIEVEDLGKLKAVPNKYHTYKEVFEALTKENPAQLYIAAYWSPRQIKEYRYGETRGVKVPRSFPQDLDILVAAIPCESVERLFALSHYTEAMYQFEGEDFQPTTDKDPRSGEEYSIRVSAGLEFELYELVEESK